MGLQPVNHLLQKLLSQRAWAHQKRFQHITQLWQQLLPPKSRDNSRPFSISQNILFVATANTTWSQHLNLQRLRLLAQLNAQLDIPLEDLRFSAAHWGRSPAYSPLGDRHSPHPSLIPEKKITPKPKPTTPTASVKQWLQQQQQHRANLPPCPCCHVPTPAGELQRWQMCACCIAQTWSKEHPPAHPTPETTEKNAPHPSKKNHEIKFHK